MLENIIIGAVKKWRREDRMDGHSVQRAVDWTWYGFDRCVLKEKNKKSREVIYLQLNEVFRKDIVFRLCARGWSVSNTTSEAVLP